MFVCPQCGYRDDPCWKAHRHMIYVIYCHIDELAAFQPELAAKLQLQPRLEEGPYFYKLGKTGYVLRAPKELKQFVLGHKYTEHYKPYDPRQQRLHDSNEERRP